MRHDDWQPLLRRLRRGRPFTGRRSHRRRAALGMPGVVMLVAALAAGTAAGVWAAGRHSVPAAVPPGPAAMAPAPVQPGPSPTAAGAPTNAAAPPVSAAVPPPGADVVPSAAARPAATGPELQISRAAVPPVVDLSAEGTIDWVHWAERDVWSLERRRDGRFTILEGTPTAPRERVDDAVERYRWRDGEPLAASDGSRAAVRTCGPGNGFTVSVPAAGQTRVLRLYVGAVHARARLTARLPDGEPVVADLDAPDARTVAYTLTYRSPTAGRLEIGWAAETAYGPGCSGVLLSAATLS